MEHVDEAGLARQLRAHDLDGEEPRLPRRVLAQARAIDLGHPAAGDQPEEEVLAERHRIIRRAAQQLAVRRGPLGHRPDSTTSPLDDEGLAGPDSYASFLDPCTGVILD